MMKFGAEIALYLDEGHYATLYPSTVRAKPLAATSSFYVFNLNFSKLLFYITIFSISEMKFVISKHGNPIISYLGYKYSKQRAYGAKTRWQCATHTHKQCRAFIYTVYNNLLRHNLFHNH